LSIKINEITDWPPLTFEAAETLGKENKMRMKNDKIFETFESGGYCLIDISAYRSTIENHYTNGEKKFKVIEDTKRELYYLFKEKDNKYELINLSNNFEDFLRTIDYRISNKEKEWMNKKML